jgi:hypothetical protein
MATFSKQTFSAGVSLLVTGTTSAAAKTIHTVPGAVKDEIWIYGTNNDISSINLTIEFGDSSATNNIKQSIPATSGLTILVPGLILTGTSTVKAFAATTEKITLHGYVNRIS